MWKRNLILFITISMAFRGLMPLNMPLHRIQGSSRVTTAAKVSENTFETSEIVLLVNGSKYVDGLPASTLANHLGAPILLSDEEDVPNETLREMRRLGAKKVLILGGNKSISKSVVRQLREEGYAVRRIAGKNRFETSEKILQELEAQIDINEIYLASNIADAVSSGAYRGEDIPLVLIADGQLSEYVMEHPAEKTVLGGEASVNEETFKRARARRRIGGKNRYETAAIIAGKFQEEAGAMNAILVNGNEFVDAFTATTFAYQNNLNILLTPGTYLEENTKKWIHVNQPDLTLIGGENSVAELAVYRTEPVEESNLLFALERASEGPRDLPKPIDPSQPMIAITYDDGPVLGYTDRVIDALNANHAKATFFVLGFKAVDHPDLLQMMVENGHEIGNHTYGHESLVKLSVDGIRREIAHGNEIIRQGSGRDAVMMRPPFGDVNETVLMATPMPLIYWSIDTRDWDHQDVETTVSMILDHVKDGDIVLMHDTLESTVLASQRVLPKLRERGFQMVTISELFLHKGIHPEPGNLYRNIR